MKKNESNFKKALNELLGSGSDEAAETQKEPETDYLQTDKTDAQTEESLDNQTSEKYGAEEYAAEEYGAKEPAPDQSVPETPVLEEQLPEETGSAAKPPVLSQGNSDISVPRPLPEKPVYEAVITPDVIINGNIIAGSNLKILGKVFGNVDCEGTIVLSGNIEGDVSAEKLRFMAGDIQGNVSVRQDITAEKGTHVKGDVAAQSAVFSGDMRGELIVRENLELRETSSVFGNIKARGIAIYNGSRIKGMLDIGGEVEEMRTENES